VKVTSWLNNVWHLAEAQKQGWSEVVLLNERSEVAECTTANIFSVKDGIVATPPLSSGCLEGVTRSVLLEIAPRNGVPMIERALTPDDLFAAEEVFITSTNRSLLGVSEIAGHKYAAAPGPVAQRLEQAFIAVMRKYVARQTANLGQ
jgi:branched-chain amino acid aminotransferase